VLFSTLALLVLLAIGLAVTRLETEETAPSLRTYALLALTVGIIATVSGALALEGNSSTNGSSTSSSQSGSAATAAVEDQGRGIQLVLSVTPSRGPAATSFEVNATVLNILSHANNVTGIGDFHGVQFNPLCNTGPVTFEVLQGHYTTANFTAGTPLAIHGVQNMMCMVPTSALSYYVFQPQSDVFTAPLPQEQGMGAAVSTTRSATAAGSLVNVYSSGLADPEPFPAGVYTVVAADNWGQLAAVHFVVTG
jgi:hypothetical protein